ncbi:hypothetical protein GC330_00250 [Yersinia pestis]|uniref:hypothetical protein n=1 Tax=Yersinia pestis TaxID=632 RepID=UPI0001D043EF|nr:hypothetical protein [Yersinia pestis]ADE63219.1 hypothetical protein YPZ3_0309 [Yersinia pestis Z176003]MBE7735556.1 hypothetical protein [Yersinia pestis]MBE7739335.1 hypothetical protein [Yersinia pestis]MBE7743784.1 hypothetical protein [Yersinia pestis]MBE7751301.1 hypothetical protein [Yersinia pestis]
MFHQPNYVVVAIRFLSAVLRVLLVWPGVVLAVIGFMFFVSTLGDPGGQKAASRMANIAQNYCAAPDGMVMVQPCPYPDAPDLKPLTESSAVPIKKRDCKPYPQAFAEVAAKERHLILVIGSGLVALGLLVELVSLLIRRRQMSWSTVYYGSINAKGERNITLQSGETVNDKEGRHE